MQRHLVLDRAAFPADKCVTLSVATLQVASRVVGRSLSRGKEAVPATGRLVIERPVCFRPPSGRRSVLFGAWAFKPVTIKSSQYVLEKNVANICIKYVDYKKIEFVPMIKDLTNKTIN